MASINLSSAPAFGFEFASCNAELSYEQTPIQVKDRYKGKNIRKVMGYIPIIGMLLGITRIRQARVLNSQQLPNRFNHIVRGSIEALNLGFLLLIPDLLLTAARAIRVSLPRASAAEQL